MKNPGTPYRLEIRADSLSSNEEVTIFPQSPQEEFSLRNMYVRGTLCFMLQANSGIGLEKVSFSFEPQRRSTPHSVQTTVQLCSFHKLGRFYSQSFKLGFSNIWPKNFQIYKLGFEKEICQKSNSQYSLDHGERKEVSEKHQPQLYSLC